MLNGILMKNILSSYAKDVKKCWGNVLKHWSEEVNRSRPQKGEDKQSGPGDKTGGSLPTLEDFPNIHSRFMQQFDYRQ